MARQDLKRKELIYIDLFAGCGGLSLGLYNSGWKGLFAIEKSPDAFKTLKFNLIDKKEHFKWPSWLPLKNHDIRQVLRQHEQNLLALRGKVDLVTGGPPCQGFSTAGKRDEADQRNKLINQYIRFIELVRPRILFFENVKGFTLGFTKNKTKGKHYSTYVSNKLKKIGYDICGDMVDFSKFGIPQKRCRFILVGVRKDISKRNHVIAEDFFEKIISKKNEFLINKDLKLNPSLEEAISDLLQSHGQMPSPDTKKFNAGIYSTPLSKYQNYLRKDRRAGEIADSHRFVNHKPEIKKRFKEILEVAKRNTSISDELKAKFGTKKRNIIPLAQKLPTPTITTLPDDYIHYCEPRIMTVREYARIQSFPDDYEFKGKYTTGGKRRVKEVPRYTQIGNAIPPLFGEQGGLVLKEFL
jgi:DNA (cytosine-5)-methyltransferase 1